MDTFPSPSIVDVAALALVAFAALRGLIRGLSGELAGLISNTAALVLGVTCYQSLGGWLRLHTRLVGTTATATAFFVIVLGIILLMLLLRMTVGRIFRVVVDDGVNRPGGVIAGILRGLVMVMIVFAGMLVIPNENLHRRFGEESVVGTVVQRLIPRLEQLTERAEELDFPDVMQ